jgi:molybdopterin-guanine dinucleotide biosynthesis protein A
LATVGGVRIIDRVANALRAVAPELILVSNAADAAHWMPGVAVARDARPERGSLVGLHTALSSSTASDGALVVAWDMPFITAALLSLIIEAKGDGAFAVVPEGPSGLEPMCAFYSRRCLPAIDAAIDGGDLRLSSFIERLSNVRRVVRSAVARVGDPLRLFFNVNTPGDLAAAEAMAGAPPLG